MMLGFTGVQYNDPDAPQWVLLYSIPALWMYAVTFRLQGVLRSADLRRLLWASVLFYAGTVIYYWPTMPNFWLKEVWIVEEAGARGHGPHDSRWRSCSSRCSNLQLPSAERRAKTLTPTAKAQRT